MNILQFQSLYNKFICGKKTNSLDEKIIAQKDFYKYCYLKYGKKTNWKNGVCFGLLNAINKGKAIVEKK